jgi:hypothetical protein
MAVFARTIAPLGIDDKPFGNSLGKKVGPD